MMLELSKVLLSGNHYEPHSTFELEVSVVPIKWYSQVLEAVVPEGLDHRTMYSSTFLLLIHILVFA